jgi:hypothetical protein
MARTEIERISLQTNERENAPPARILPRRQTISPNVMRPGNANLPIGVACPASREIDIPGRDHLYSNWTYG